MTVGFLPELQEGFSLIEWYAPKILERFSRAEDLNKLLDGIGASRQEILIALKEISEGFQILKAEGIQLDIIGYKFGVLRRGEEDNPFRVRIVAIGSAKISGTTNQVILMLKLLGYGTLGQKLNQIRVIPLWVGGGAAPGEPAAYVVILDDPNSIGDPTQEQLESISCAGVGVSQGWWLLLEGETDEYILIEDDTPGDGEGEPITVY
ncbi:MAG: hypothetical protein KAR06_12170 [Deltaproteobacteria bacterium]|nr:hypothetical protein [Deltaproteobacteria bacterium]